MQGLKAVCLYNIILLLKHCHFPHNCTESWQIGFRPFSPSSRSKLICQRFWSSCFTTSLLGMLKCVVWLRCVWTEEKRNWIGQRHFQPFFCVQFVSKMTKLHWTLQRLHFCPRIVLPSKHWKLPKFSSCPSLRRRAALWIQWAVPTLFCANNPLSLCVHSEAIDNWMDDSLLTQLEWPAQIKPLCVFSPDKTTTVTECSCSKPSEKQCAVWQVEFSTLDQKVAHLLWPKLEWSQLSMAKSCLVCHEQVWGWQGENDAHDGLTAVDWGDPVRGGVAHSFFHHCFPLLTQSCRLCTSCSMRGSLNQAQFFGGRELRVSHAGETWNLESPSPPRQLDVF